MAGKWWAQVGDDDVVCVVFDAANGRETRSFRKADVRQVSVTVKNDTALLTVFLSDKLGIEISTPDYERVAKFVFDLGFAIPPTKGELENASVKP